MNLEVSPGGRLVGEWVVPGDKSISHRALLLGAIAEGKTDIEGFLFSEDCLATLRALQQCGVEFSSGPEHITVYGRGLKGLTAPADPLDCQNSGTSLRLLAGILAAQSFSSQLIGDSSLSMRPMKRIVEPLQQMGADIHGKAIGSQIYAPLQIKGIHRLNPFEYALPVASAQVKSCLLLASVVSQSEIVLTEKIPTRDHTERMLQAFGADIYVGSSDIRLKPGKTLQGRSVQVPGDISSAAFFIAAASFIEGSHIFLRNVGVNPTRTGIISILQAMGADITLHDVRMQSGEPVADLEVKAAPLQGVEIPVEWVVPAIDEFPIIFVAAAFAKGTTTIRGLQELRYKETDRLGVMARELKKLGAVLTEWSDGIAIEGGTLSGGTIETEGDHRIAMAFAMAGSKIQDTLIIREVDNIATSFPGFVDFANQCGLTIKETA